MSQKKIKRMRKKQKILANSMFDKKAELVEVKGIRQILKENWKYLLTILILTVAVYINSMWGDFVSDDYATILHNPEIATKWAGGEAASDNPFEIIPIIHHLTAVLFGATSPVPFHIFSLFVYLLNIIVGFVLIYLLLGKTVAILASLLFALHPIHVEAVSWISGKPYSFTGLFQIGAYISLFYVLNKRQKYWWYLTICLLLSFLSARVHSTAFLFVGPLIVYYMSTSNNKIIDKKLFVNFLVILFGILPIVFFILWPNIKMRVGDVNFGYKGDGGIFYDPFFQYPTSVAKYLQLLWLPIDLTLYHTMYTFPVWLNWLIFSSYLGLLVISFFKDKDMFFCLAFIFLATAPTMAPVKVSWLVAERYIFLGSLGWCGFLAILITRYMKWLGKFSYVLIFLIIGLFAIKIIYRNLDWQTNHNLWVATVQTSPNSHNAWNNIGDDYDKLGQYENAIKGFSQSTVWKTNYADAYHNRANIYFKIGRFDLARDSYMTALSFNPSLVQTYISLVQIELTVGKLDAALEVANKAVEIAPNNFQARYAKAIVLRGLNMLAEAKKEAEMSLRLNPNFQLAKELYNAI